MPGVGYAQEGDPAIIAKMQQINAQLRERGQKLAVEQIEFFTIGQGRQSGVKRLNQATGPEEITNSGRTSKMASPLANSVFG